MMKCAIELLAIAKEAEALRVIEEQAKIEKARLEALARRKRTIEWCEEVLASYLEKQAICWKPFATGSWTWECGDGNEMHFDSYGCDRKLLRPLRYDRKYADGRKAFVGTGDYLDVDVITEYCTQFCIEVKVKARNYYRYGWGVELGAELQFRISPECLNK